MVFGMGRKPRECALGTLKPADTSGSPPGALGNNAAKRALRIIAIRRRNFLLAGHE